MALVYFDIELDQYADYSGQFLYSLRASPGAPKVPVDLGGYTAKLMGRVNSGDPNPPPLSISTTPNAQGSIVLQPTIGGVVQTGLIQVFILHVASATLPVLLGHDLELLIGQQVIPFGKGRVLNAPGNVH